MVRKLPAPSTVTNPVLPDKIDVEPPRTTNARTSALLDERTSIENVTIMRRPEVPLVRPLAAERYKVQFTVGRERVVDDLATQHSLPPASDLTRAPLPRRRTRRMPFTNPRFRQTALVVHVQLAGDQAAVSSETARRKARGGDCRGRLRSRRAIVIVAACLLHWCPVRLKEKRPAGAGLHI